MRKRKPRPIPKVIQEQLEALGRERVEAVDAQEKAIAYQKAALERLEEAKAYNTNLSSAVGALRGQLEDMRRQRDKAVDDAENQRRRARTAEASLARAMGWVDAKMLREPVLGDNGEWPF